MTELEELLVSGLTAAHRPLYSGAVALIQRDGRVEHLALAGHTAHHPDLNGTPVSPAESRKVDADTREVDADTREVDVDTLFDLASITKLFVTTALLSLVEEALLALDEPVATWLPGFGGGDRRAVTLRRLMTHTSGLPAHLPLWKDWPDRAARVRAVLEAPLVHPPGTHFEYSCIGYLLAGLLAERATGRGLADLVRERVCAPLGLAQTGYTPPADRLPRIAATEYQPQWGRGLVRGQVHDENAWSLGGTAGNAGIFGTAGELARFGELLRGDGSVDGVRVLAADTIAEMTRDQLPAGLDPGFRHGLGVRIADPQSMGVLAADGAFGHTGFTGTSLVVDRPRRLVVVLLTNRVHPSRDWSDVGELRRAVARLASRRDG